MKEPKQIGKYKLLRELGRGGMGVVFEAEHVEVRHRVAIKLLDSRYASEPQVLARFRSEGIAANLPRHPAIVSVLERGVRESDGSPYIVMEFVEGKSLRSQVKAHPYGMPIGMVQRLGAQIADALAAAHRAHVIHRDIKPENVMLTPDSAVRGGERAKVLDFGIAVIRSDQINLSGVETEIKTDPLAGLVGTVFYMAPEQWQGVGRDELDEKADVYQLGVMLYEMLVGRPPFVSKEPLSIGFKHISESPQPPQERRTEIPKELSDLVLAMLAKKPSARPAMSRVATTLDRLEEASSAPSIPGDATGIPVYRPRRAIVLAMLALGLTAVGVAFWEFRPRSRHVTWQIDSVPTGAAIIGPGGQVLGQTPLRLQQKRDAGKVELTIRLLGYQDARVFPDCDANFVETVRLEPKR